MAEHKETQRDNRAREAGLLTESLLKSGQISQSAARKLFEALGYAPKVALPDTTEGRGDFISWLSGALKSLFTVFGASLAGVIVAAKQDTRKPDKTTKAAADNHDVTAPPMGGVDSLLSFESLSQTLKPLFNEYVWWFIAMVLVISGSIMGIREAWLRFEGILRPFTILFAFFVYHAMFLGLGIFLYRKSAGTGKMLLLIAAGLIPLMFSIANSITRLSPEAGAAATAVSLVLSCITLLPMARRLDIPYISAVLYLPVPFALGALSGLAVTIPFVLPLVILALTAATLSATGMQGGAGSAPDTRSSGATTRIATTEKPLQRFAFAVVGIVILVVILAGLQIPLEDDLSRALRQMSLMALLGQFALLLRSLDLARANFFTAIEITAYAVVALIALVAAKPLAGALGSTAPFSFKILALPLGIGIFLRAAKDHNAAIHAVLFLSMAFILRVTKLFTAEYPWHIFAFFIFPLVIPWFPSAALRAGSAGFHENKKRIFLYWAVIAGICGSFAQLVAPQPHIAAALTGLLTAITIHRAAGLSRSAWHYLSPIGVLVFVARLPLPAGIVLQPNEIFFAMAVIYALGGIWFERHSTPADDASPGFPLEDLSLVCGALALLTLPTGLVTDAGSWTLAAGGRIILLRPLLWVLVAYLFLALRSLRDRSVLVSAFAHLAVLPAIYRIAAPRDHAEAGIFFILAAAVLYCIAALLRDSAAKGAEPHGRVFLLRLRLPFDGGRVNNIGYGAGVAALVMMCFAFFNALNWIGNPDFDARGFMLMAQIGFLLLVVLIFHFRVFTAFRLRGSLALFFVLLFGIAFTAIINRLGRPLPVDAVALRLLLLFPLMVLLTLAIKVYGPRYGKYLEADKQGVWYYLVPVTGVIGLFLLLFYEVATVSSFDFDRAFGFVPPTAYLALALYPLILTHSVALPFRHAFYFFVPVFLAALFAEHSFLGPALSNANELRVWLPAAFTGPVGDALNNFAGTLSPGYSYLAFRQNIVLGVAAGVSLLAILALISRRQNAATMLTNTLFSKNSLGVSFESGLWSLGYTAIIALLSFQVASVPPGVILIAVAALYLGAGNVRASALILFTGGLLVVHGGAHLANIYPTWPGPVLVAAAIFLVLPAKKIAAKLDLAENFVSETSFLAGTLYVLAGFFYAATEGQGANALQAGISVLSANGSYFARADYYRSLSLVLTLLLTALYFRLSLRLIEGRARAALAFASNLFCTAAIATAGWFMLSKLGHTFNFLIAAPFVLTGILLFQIIVTLLLGRLREVDPDRYAGYFTARDTVIVVCGLLFIALSTNLVNPLPYAGLFTLVALVLYLVLNITAAFSSAKTRYVYIAQATIAGMYFSLRPMLGINSAQVDAFFAFGYAFLLLGVSIAAQRFSITVVSEPTRRFAAIMPVVVALVTDNFRTFNTALYSLLSSGLYFLLSRLGERHIFAALAAITLNATLFFLALASGYDSSEFYAFPAGLTIIFFATIFKDSLSAENQARVRTIGGLIAYIPAAIHVTLRSGLAQNPMYSLAFGGVCLAGILAGTIFHIRSYLFLGVLFFTLNIVANLVQEGLQNQFVGFILLTLTGLLLITILIIYNLKKDQVHEAFRRLRMKFATWN